MFGSKLETPQERRERNLLNLRSVVVFLAAFLTTPLIAEEAPLLGLDRIEKAEPWKAVGRVDTSTGFCTGTLIAPDLVLTAAHCTYVRSTGAPTPPRDMVFRAGFRHGKAQAERRVVQIARPAEYNFKGIDDANNIRTDVALLRLATPIASHIISPFLVEQRALTSGTVSVVSYGSGREELPSLQRECNVTDTVSGIVAMDCNVTFGSSGAPVFLRTLDKVRIASVISGVARMGGQQRTVGMALPDIVAGLKAQLRANGQGPVAKVRRITVGSRGGSGAKFVRSNGS